MSEVQQPSGHETGTLTTRLNRGWALKMAAFIIGLLGLGTWGAYDGLILFPTRGRAHAQFMQLQYLDRLSNSGLLLRGADIVDPAAEFEKLRSDSAVLGDSVEAARRDWLLSLARITDLSELTEENRKEVERRKADPGSGLKETRTLFANPRATFSALDTRLKSQKMPAPLNAYDIPLQYVIMLVGFGAGLWILMFVARCSRVSFRYEPGAKRLTLPDGRSFTAGQIRDFDKRDWHKYYEYFTIEGFDGEVKFDLLRFSPLEKWVEEMRRARPGYDPAEDEEKRENGGAAAEGEGSEQVGEEEKGSA